MGKRTPLYEQHVALGARMVDFAGWEMPIHYGSQIEEHHAVRRSAGMFDVSHMCVVDVEGARAREYLRYLLANDVARLDGAPGRALYTCMLNERGGVIDDLIVFYLDDLCYRLVVNAGTRQKDIGWLRRFVDDYGVDVVERDDLAMIAVQGPEARDRVHTVLGECAEPARGLKRFSATEVDGIFIARTGYTGEDGYELVVPADQAEEIWRRLADVGVIPCGLGARDTLRLEAGMNLYGQDMDEGVSPLECGLAWTVAFEPADRDFIGRGVLEQQRKEGPAAQLMGLVLEERGVLRPHQKVYVEGLGEGETTSGSFAPTLGVAVALARIPVGRVERVEVEIRGRRLAARVVKPPFVRGGKPNF
ncbi:glycine cleavage system aminomethyltransferase GcvT [Thiohalomonas denitrificans]|uniref:glycine cleavage system aminomethyltransferase GcvT n=1 Tax=Thiohalomonas denitrificans TaxID=415747 RepID=UPI0026F242E5|nr:glycine cleavage system aminomethyltransferase GcvT [Thiohalomonas denitrificans]